MTKERCFKGKNSKRVYGSIMITILFLISIFWVIPPVNANGAGDLDITPTKIVIDARPLETITKTVTVLNNGDNPFVATIKKSSNRIEVIPSLISLNPHEARNISISYTPLLEGIKHESISIGNSEIEIEVTCSGIGAITVEQYTQQNLQFRNQVMAATSNVTTTDFIVYYDPAITTKQYAQKVADAAQYAYDIEVGTFNFKVPDHTEPNGKISITIITDVCGSYGAASPDGKITINSDFSWEPTGEDAAINHTCAHELFHCIQRMYVSWSWLLNNMWVTEGTTELMGDEVYDDTNLYIYRINGVDICGFHYQGFMENPDRELTALSYRAVLYWKYIREQYGGVPTIKAIFEEAESTGNDGKSVTDAVLKGQGSSFDDSFIGWTIANYLNGNNNHDGNFANDQYEEGDLYDDVDLTADRTYSGTTINIPGTVNEWATDHIEFTSTVEDGVEVEFQGEEIFLLGSSNYVVKIILYNTTYPQGKVIDFVEDHKGKEIIPKANEYDKIVLVIACTGHPWTGDGDYSVILRKSAYLDVVLDFDRSGSMGWEVGKLEGAKIAGKTFIDLLEKPSGWWIFATDRDKVGLVSFSSSATLDRHLTSDFADAKNVIDGYSAGGSTNMGDALSKSISELKTNGRDDTIWSIIYFTDGLTNTGLTADEILNILVPQAVDAGINIYTCGYGTDVDSTFLSQVASAGNGEYHFAPGPATLKQIYIELSHTTKGWQPTASFSGSVSQGETKTVGALEVQPGMSLLKILLSWPGSDLDLILIDPTGNQTMPGAGVIYSGNDTLPEYYEIYDPQPGNWTIEVYGKDVSGATEDYNVMVFQPGALMHVKPTKWDIDYPVNRTKTFTVSEIAGTVDLTDVSFTASDLVEVNSTAVKAMMKTQAELEERGEREIASLYKTSAQDLDKIPASSFSFVPNDFTVPAGDSRDVQATLTIPPNTPAGNYSGTINVTSNGGNSTIMVTVNYTGAVPARVPTLTPIGIIALAGLLAIVAVSRIRRKR